MDKPDLVKRNACESLPRHTTRTDEDKFLPSNKLEKVSVSTNSEKEMKKSAQHTTSVGFLSDNLAKSTFQ
jgi:hypothetical protein